MNDCFKLAPFNPSSPAVISASAQLAGITPNDVVYDLGCGDGRVLTYLARNFGCRCVGVECDEVYYKRALNNIKEEGLSHLISIRHEDACHIRDLDEATVIFCYLSTKQDENFSKRIKKAFLKGTRIISNMFHLKCLGEPKDCITCDGVSKLYFYQQELPFVKWIRTNLDPIKNPWVMRTFNATIISLIICTLWVFTKLELGAHHFVILTVLSVALLTLLNYYVYLLKSFRTFGNMEKSKTTVERTNPAVVKKEL